MSSAALRTRATRAIASPLLTGSSRRFSAGAGAPNQSTSADIFSIIARAKQTGGSGGGGGGFEAGGGDGGDNHGLGALRVGASLARRAQHLPPAPAPEQVEGGAELRRAVRAVVGNIDAEGRLSVGGTLKLLHLQKTFLPGHVGTRRDALALLSLVRTLERKNVSLDCTFLYDVMRTACVAFPLLHAPPRAVGDFLASRLHHAAAAFKSNPIPFLERIVPLYVKACVGLQLESTHLHHVCSLLFKSPQPKAKAASATVTSTTTTTTSSPSKKRSGKSKAAQKRRAAEAAAAAAEAEAEAAAAAAAAAALPCDTVKVPAVYDETFHYALERVTLSLFDLAEKWHAKAFQRTRCVVITKHGKRPVWRERASKYHLAVLEKLEVVFEALENLTLSYQSTVLGVSTPVVENSGFYKLVLKEAKRSPAPPVIAAELTSAAAAAPPPSPPKQGRAAAAAARRKRRSVVEGVVEGPAEDAHEQLRRQFGVARDPEDGDEGEELREVYNPASEAATKDTAAKDNAAAEASAQQQQQQQKQQPQKQPQQGSVAASGGKRGSKSSNSAVSFDADVDDATFNDIQGATGALLIDEDGSVVESVVVHVEALVAGFHPTESIHVPSDQCRFALEGPQMDFQAPAKPTFKRRLFRRSPRIPKDIRDM